MSDQDIEFAKAAFNNALPPVDYRAGSTQGPRPHRGRKAAVMAGTSVAAAAALFAVTTATGSSPAWSATPSTLSAADSAHVDQTCRAASTNIIVVGNGSSGSGDVVTGGGGSVSGVTVTSGNVSTAGNPVSGGVVANGPQTSQTVRVGSLPLLLIDSRGKMALALYGDSGHHIMCNIDAQGNASISPDSGAWQSPVSPDLISANAGAAMGTVQVGDSTGTSGTMQIVGTVASSVKAMSVEVPGVGTVVATIADGYYSLFIPNSMVNSGGSTSWPATITQTDGTVVHQALSQGLGLPVQVNATP